MTHTETIQRAFETALNQDKQFIKPFMASWDYQNKRKKRNVRYNEELPQDFFRFSDPDEIVKWMNWFSGEYPSYFDPAITNPLVSQSLVNDSEIFRKLNLVHKFETYENIGLNNAHDFFIPQSYPVPAEFEIKTVVDFGAGYGRQANLWWPFVEGKGNFIGVDAIPLSYSLQSHYYHAIKSDYKEYVFEKEQFKIDPKGSDIYHLPTWRLDLIPDNSVDLIICIQVLPELSRTLINYLFKEFHRILKPGAALYLRDLNFLYKAFGTGNIDGILQTNGFSLEFRAFVKHNTHIHGIPRIWRKDTGEFDQASQGSLSRRRDYFLEWIDSLTGGRLKGKKTK